MSRIHFIVLGAYTLLFVFFIITIIYYCTIYSKVRYRKRLSAVAVILYFSRDHHLCLGFNDTNNTVYISTMQFPFTCNLHETVFPRNMVSRCTTLSRNRATNVTRYAMVTSTLTPFV